MIQKTLKMAVVIAAACAMAMMFLEGLNAAMRRSGRHALPVFTGTLIGATGIGGGVLIVPALMAASNEPLKRIIGTSVILGLVLSLITGAVYGASGALDWRITLWMTAGALLAMPIAGRLFRRMTEQQVRRLSALVIGLSITGLIIDLIVHR